MTQTKVYYLPSLTDNDFKEIADALKDGAVAVLPTDTVYGVAVCAGKNGAEDKLDKAKNNPGGKPPQVLCTFEQAVALAEVDDNFNKVSTLWPGALTIVAKSSKEGKKLLAGSPTIGLRVPADDFIIKIMEHLSSPLFASSANMHAAPVNETEADILKTFSGILDIIVLNGPIKTRPSAVVDLSADEAKIIRSGDLSESALKKLLIKPQ